MIQWKTFQPGKYDSWELPFVQQRQKMAAGEMGDMPMMGPPGMEDMSFFGPPEAKPYSVEEIRAYNHRWDPYNPLFNDVEYAKMCYPGLTTIRQNIMEKGRQSARLMIEAVQDHSLPRAEWIIPMELIERGTVKRVDGNQAYAQRPVSAF